MSVPGTSVRTNIEELHTYLFSGEPHPLEPQLTSWLSTSRRFTGFVATAKNKIRKKLRAVKDPESAADLQLELETAYLLLQERKFGIDYEPHVSGRSRRPDFAVNYTTHSTLMLEVTRLRLQTEIVPERVINTVCSKLGQFLPQRSNILLIGSPVPITPLELHAVMSELQGRAERGDRGLFKQFRDRGDFFSSYRRLSEILFCTLPRRADSPLVGWINPQAKHPLPSKVQTALHLSQTVKTLPERSKPRG